MSNGVVGEYVVKLTPEVDKQKLRASESQVEKSAKRVQSRTRAMLGGVYGFGKGAKDVLGASISGGLGAGLSALGASLPFIGALAVGAGVATISLQSLNKQINDIGDATLGWGDTIGTLTGQLADSGVSLKSGQVALDSATFGALGVDQTTFIKGLAMFEKNRQNNESLKDFKDGDTRTAFFDFFDSIRGLETKDRMNALEQAFGGRGAIAFQEVSQTDLNDIRERVVKQAGFKTEKALVDSATKSIDNTASLEEQQAVNRQALELSENIKRGDKIDKNFINEQFKQEKAKSQIETKNLDLATPTMRASTTIEELENRVKTSSVDVAKTIETSVNKIIDYMKGRDPKKEETRTKRQKQAEAVLQYDASTGKSKKQPMMY